MKIPCYLLHVTPQTRRQKMGKHGGVVENEWKLEMNFHIATTHTEPLKCEIKIHSQRISAALRIEFKL